MKRIDDYERILDQLHEDLTAQCTELRERLDSVYDQDPGQALEATQQLTDVFSKLKTLKDQGETLRAGLDALREMERLKTVILDTLSELGPEYAKYCSARAALQGDGDARIQALFTEADADFAFDYGELEGRAIGPFRALDPSCFEEADILAERAGLGHQVADLPMAASPAPAPVAAPAPAPEPEPVPEPEPTPVVAAPFATDDAFEAEAVGAAEAGGDWGPAPGAESVYEPPPAAALEPAFEPAPEPAFEPEPEPAPAMAAPAFEPEPEPDLPEMPEPEFEPEPAAAPELAVPPAPAFEPAQAFDPAPEAPEVAAEDVAALSAMLDESDPSPESSPIDPDPEDAMADLFGHEAAPQGDSAAALMSMMDDDEDDFDLVEDDDVAAAPEPPQAPEPPAPPPAPEPPPIPEAPASGELAGEAAASLLAELDDDDEDDLFDGFDFGGEEPAPKKADPLDDF